MAKLLSRDEKFQQYYQQEKRLGRDRSDQGARDAAARRLSREEGRPTSSAYKPGGDKKAAPAKKKSGDGKKSETKKKSGSDKREKQGGGVLVNAPLLTQRPVESPIRARPEGPVSALPAAATPPGSQFARPEGPVSALPMAATPPGSTFTRPAGPASSLPAAPAGPPIRIDPASLGPNSPVAPGHQVLGKNPIPVAPVVGAGNPVVGSGGPVGAGSPVVGSGGPVGAGNPVIGMPGGVAGAPVVGSGSPVVGGSNPVSGGGGAVGAGNPAIGRDAMAKLLLMLGIGG